MTSCSCDGDPPTLFQMIHVKARKDHRCCECRGTISKGETYRKDTGCWEGKFQTFKMCSDCVGLAEWASQIVPCLCWSYGNLHSDISEQFSETLSGTEFDSHIAEALFLMTNITMKRKAHGEQR